MKTLGLIALIAVASQASAVIIAQDVASNYTNGASYVGLNGGSGFQAWAAGGWPPISVIGTSSLNGTGIANPNIDTAGRAFGIRQIDPSGPGFVTRNINYANPSAINLVRFSVDLGSSDAGFGISATKGFYMSASFGGARMGVAYHGGQTNLRFLNDTGPLTTVASILPHTSTRVNVQVFKLGGQQVQVTLTDALSGISDTKTFTNTSLSNFSQFQFISYQTGTGSVKEAFANNLEVHANAVVPEPASLAAVGLGVTALIRRRRKTR
jgi:hypothetical protein